MTVRGQELFNRLKHKTIVVYEWDAHYEERLAGTVQVLSNSAARRQAAREEALRLTIEGDEATETGNG